MKRERHTHTLVTKLFFYETRKIEFFFYEIRKTERDRFVTKFFFYEIRKRERETCDQVFLL